MIDFTKTTPQTSRTILFGKYSNGSSIIGSMSNHLTLGENMESIRHKLEEEFTVNSFAEFIEKFPPIIYMETSVVNGEAEFNYSEKPKPGSVPIRIKEHQFYKMVEELIRIKSENGDANVDSIYSVIDEMLSPKKALEDSMKKRRTLLDLYKIADDAAAQHKTIAAKKAQNQINMLLNDIEQTYSDNALLCLPLKIADKQDKLNSSIKLLGQSVNEIEEGVEIVEEAPKLITGGKFVWGPSGRLEYKGAEEISEPSPELIPMKEDKLYLAIRDMAERMPSIRESEETKELFISRFSEKEFPVAEITKESVKNDIAELNILKDNYLKSQEGFIKAIIDIMQRVLDVEMFFRHAVQSSSDIQPLKKSLIVANCDLAEVCESANRDIFKMYLSAISSKASERIWFALLPPVEHDPVNVKPKGDSLNLKSVTDLLAEYQIFSFFSLKAGGDDESTDDTGFASFSGTERYEGLLAGINKDYTVLCYPNFTVIPLDESERKIVEAVSFEDAEVEDAYLNINSVYVHASFVAAGLVAASQDPEILRNKGYKIREELTCARFELEPAYEKFITGFNMENFFNWPDALKKKLRSKPLGICFSSDDLMINGEPVRNSYLFHVRNNKGDALYPFMVKQVITQYFKSQNMTSEQIEEEVNKINEQSAKLCAIASNKNILIRTDKDEKLEYVKDSSGTGKISIIFSELSAPVSLDIDFRTANNE